MNAYVPLDETFFGENFYLKTLCSIYSSIKTKSIKIVLYLSSLLKRFTVEKTRIKT